MEPPPAGRPAAPAPAAADALRPGQAPASEPAPEPPPDAASVARVQQLLAARDDTQRFVGLALLKALLDTSPQLRRDEQAVRSLWLAVSPAFLDRLLRTGSKPPADQTARHMLDLVVSLLHTFAALLPRDALAEPKLAGRAPRLVDALLYSCVDTTTRLLELLHALASTDTGALALVRVEDLTPLTEIAPAHAAAMDVLRFAWLNAMVVVEDKSSLSAGIDASMQALASSFTGTDAVTFLEFVSAFLRQADAAVLPTNPRWLKPAAGYVKRLVAGRPAPQARAAYTNASAALLQAYPSLAPKLLFTDEAKDDKPFAYLLVNLMLIDIRSSVPTLLERLNTPEYPPASRRLASAFDVVTIFIGYLMQSLDDDSRDALVMAPDSLLKLRKSLSETMSVTVEYLRDRWDASVAGAMGLDVRARAGTATTSMGTHYTLAWDSATDSADDDPLILSAVRALALWLREEENDVLRKEATGLMDMLMDLYRGAQAPAKLDFRSAVLVALEALVSLPKGREALLRHQGWRVLTADLASVAEAADGPRQAPRGVEIVRVLLQVVEQEACGTEEEWMDVVTAVAAWDVSGARHMAPAEREFRVAALQLCCALLEGAGAGMRRRYRHSRAALAGMAHLLGDEWRRDGAAREGLDDVAAALRHLELE